MQHPKNASGNTLERRHQELLAEFLILCVLLAKNAFFREISFLLSSASLYYHLSDAQVILLPAFQIFVKVLKASFSCPSITESSANASSVAIPMLVVPDPAWSTPITSQLTPPWRWWAITSRSMWAITDLLILSDSQHFYTVQWIYQAWPIFYSNNLLWIVLGTLWGYTGLWYYSSVMRYNTITAVGTTRKCKTIMLYNLIP